jgi:hypothetical protein
MLKKKLDGVMGWGLFENFGIGTHLCRSERSKPFQNPISLSPSLSGAIQFGLQRLLQRILASIRVRRYKRPRSIKDQMAEKSSASAS